MKILVLVLSYNKHPFDELMMAQQSTWDSVNVDGVKTIYYHGVPLQMGLAKDSAIAIQHHAWSTQLACGATDDYYFMSGKFKVALRASEAEDYDLIFRTNSSCYVNKKKLVEFASGFPKEKFYAGWTINDSNYDGRDGVSGAGIWLSRDCAEILQKEIDPSVELEEDVYIGRILRKHGMVAVDDRSRIDYPAEAEKIHDTYHIRFKTTDRVLDATNMGIVHKKLS